MVPRPAVNIGSAPCIFPNSIIPPTNTLPPLSFLSFNATSNQQPPQTPFVPPATGATQVSTSAPGNTTPSTMATIEYSPVPESLTTPDIVAASVGVNMSTEFKPDTDGSSSQHDHQQKLQNSGFASEVANEPVSSVKSSSDTGNTIIKSTNEESTTEESELSPVSNGLKDRLIPKTIVSDAKTGKVTKDRHRQQTHGHGHVQGLRGPVPKANRERTMVFDENVIYKSASPVPLSKEAQFSERALMGGCSKNLSQNSSTETENGQALKVPQAPQPVDPHQLEDQLRQVQLTQGHQQQSQTNGCGLRDEQIQTPSGPVSHLTIQSVEDDQPFPANPPSSVQEIGEIDEIDVNVEHTRPIMMPDVWKEVDLNINEEDINVQSPQVQSREHHPPVWSRVTARTTAAARWMRQKTVAGFHWMGQCMRSAARNCGDIFGIE